MSVLHGHLVEHPASDTQRIVDMYIDNMPAGGGTPGANSITTAMLQNGQVTDAKLAQDAVGEGNIKNGAVTKSKLASGVLPVAATKTTPGIVKQAAKVENCASGDGAACKDSINAIIQSLKDAGIMASA